MAPLKILSVGALRGVLEHVRSSEGGAASEVAYGAGGTIVARILGGEQADIVIVSDEAMAGLAAKGIVDPSSIAALGLVRAAVAVRDGDAVPPLSTGDDLRNAILQADAIYMPDPARSPSGKHVVSVIEKFGIGQEVWSRLRFSPTGNDAMSEMCRSDAVRPIGFTQASEVLETPGVVLAGLIPHPYELATMYEIAITSSCADRAAADDLVEALSGDRSAAIREKAGFRPA